MGINIGSLSSVMLGGVPPNQANFIQRVGRAGRRDGNAAVFAIADASLDGHDQYYFANPLEMLHGDVEAPAIYLNAAEVLRRQLYAFFFDNWVAEESPALPDKLSEALDQVAKMDGDTTRFPFNYLDFVNRNEPALFDAFCRMLGDAAAARDPDEAGGIHHRDGTAEEPARALPGLFRGDPCGARVLEDTPQGHQRRGCPAPRSAPRTSRPWPRSTCWKRSGPDWGSASRS